SFAARQGGMVAQAFASMGVSPDPMETEQIFESQYQDELVLGITSLMKMIALENNLESYKMEVAKSIALSGVAAIEAYAVGNRIVEQILEPSEIGWDPASVKPDFSDGEFMFHCPVMTVDQIAEEFQPDEAVIKALDKWLDVDAGSWAFGRGRIRVYKVYYKDIEKYEGGFVEEDGEKVFVPINSPTETKDGKPKYTDKDLVEPPDTQMTSTWTDKEWAAKKVVRYREVTRYGVLIPWVCLPPSVTKEAKSFNPKSLGSEGAYLKGILNGNGDLVLAGGKVFPQEVNPDDTYGKGFP